jgi:hypothetical protein
MLAFVKMMQKSTVRITGSSSQFFLHDCAPLLSQSQCSSQLFFFRFFSWQNYVFQKDTANKIRNFNPPTTTYWQENQTARTGAGWSARFKKTMHWPIPFVKRWPRMVPTYVTGLHKQTTFRDWVFMSLDASAKTFSFSQKITMQYYCFKICEYIANLL